MTIYYAVVVVCICKVVGINKVVGAFMYSIFIIL